jgi:preprotein translocase subunit Sss1
MEKIADKLNNINCTLEKILKVMDKPENPFIKILKIAGLFAGFLAIIHVIDTIFNWFKEGLW